jgi:hypothetical protein
MSGGLKLAREQKARSLELRLCTSMHDLYAANGDAGKCRQQLSTIYRSFREGLDTADLVNARSRLDKL